MKVLVTGASGFIGSFLCRDLLEAGHTVAVLLRDKSAWRLADVIDRVQIISGDLSDSMKWQADMNAFAPDAVAHLGWSGVGNAGRNDPVQRLNLEWTTDLLRKAGQAGAKTFVALGSQAEYGPKENPIKERDSENPTTLYGEVKLATQRECQRIARGEGMRFCWMRVFSTYGPTDHPYWMIPSLICSLVRQERPALTKGEQIWDYLHVTDAARAIRMVLEHDTAEGVFNLGSGDGQPLGKIIRMIRDMIDPTLELGLGDVPYRPDQVMRLEADIGKLVTTLDWRPVMPLEIGLEECVRWYSANSEMFTLQKSTSA